MPTDWQFVTFSGSLCRTCWQMAQPAVSRESASRQQLHQTSAGSMSHAAAPSNAQMQQEAIAEASSKLLAADATNQGATCSGRSRTARQRRDTKITHEGQGSTVAAAKPSRPRRQAAGSTKVAKLESSSATSISSSILASGSAAADGGAIDCAQHSRDDLGSTGASAKVSRRRGAAAGNVKVVKPQQDSCTSISSSTLASSIAAAGALDMEPSASAGSGKQQIEEGPGSTAAPAKLMGFRQAEAGSTLACKEQRFSSTSSSSTPTSIDAAAFADPLDEDSAALVSDCEQPPEQLKVDRSRRPAARQTGGTASSKAAVCTSRRAVHKVDQEQQPACQQAAASKAAAGGNSVLPTSSRQGRVRACPPAAVSPVTQTQPRTRMSR